MDRITAVGLDADDTLWHNERHFKATEAAFAALLAPYADPDHLMERLLVAERRNIGHYGFGVKGFTLSMIETAADVIGGDVPQPVLRRILDAGREMLSHPVELLPGAAEVVARLSGRVALILVTKGDLLDQERKLAASGLGDAFDAVAIVSDKTPPVYARTFAEHGQGAARGLMAGNSLRSDVLPMIAAGGTGVHVPHGQEWAFEAADPPADRSRFHEIVDIWQLPPLLDRINSGEIRATVPI